VPVRDADAIADAIKRLLEDAGERRRLSIAGRERILRMFSWKVAAAQMVNYYRQIAAQKQ